MKDEEIKKIGEGGKDELSGSHGCEHNNVF
jgi:hypothetical protein